MSLPEIPVCHHSIRDALYLLSNTKLIDEPCEQLAYRLDMTAATIKRWRKRLERLGHVRTELVRPRYRKMWLANAYASSREQTLLDAPVTGVN